MKNILLETIKKALNDIHIESGTKDQFKDTCLLLEKEISKKILSHDIDYYSERLKLNKRTGSV